LNIPYDLLLSDNSNKASSQTAKEFFNENKIQPAQKLLIKDFKRLFEDYDVNDLKYRIIDTKDQKEEMEVWT
jgi:hypothetical protein